MGGVGVPIRDDTGEVVAALSIGASSDRIRRREVELAEMLKKEAQVLARAMAQPANEVKFRLQSNYQGKLKATASCGSPGSSGHHAPPMPALQDLLCLKSHDVNFRIPPKPGFSRLSLGFQHCWTRARPDRTRPVDRLRLPARIDDHPFHALFGAGRIVDLAPAPVLMRSWRFSYRASPQRLGRILATGSEAGLARSAGADQKRRGGAGRRSVSVHGATCNISRTCRHCRGLRCRLVTP